MSKVICNLCHFFNVFDFVNIFKKVSDFFFHFAIKNSEVNIATTSLCHPITIFIFYKAGLSAG